MTFYLYTLDLTRLPLIPDPSAPGFMQNVDILFSTG